MDSVAIFLILSHLVAAALTNEVHCNISVDITDGQLDGTSITKDGITYDENNYYTNGTDIRGCICNLKQCIRRCCSEGEVLNVTSRTCVSLSSQALSDFTPYYIVNVPENQICEEKQYKVKVEDNFTVQEGVLIWDKDEYVLEDYCVDEVENTKVAVVCVQADSEIDRIVMCIGMLISMPFLLITLIVYAILPESNLHRKALMFYVATLLIAYIFLVTIQLHDKEIPPGVCEFMGFSVIFFFIASFFWMNVMCIDMWLTFSGLRGFSGQRHAERKRFILYSIYAWSMPVLLLVVVALVQTYSDEDSDFNPGVGMGKCFLRDKMPNLLYFYGPMAAIILLNTILFALTAIKIQKVKKETSMLKHSDSKRHSYEDDKHNLTEHVNKKTNTLYRFNLYLKLFLAMGINWTMEIISWAVMWYTDNNPPAYIWYFTDFVNAMYGVLIFFIFVFKKKIWKSLQKRYYVFIGKPHLAHSLTTTHTTRSNFSTTDTTLVSDHRMSDLKNGRDQRPLTQN